MSTSLPILALMLAAALAPGAERWHHVSAAATEGLAGDEIQFIQQGPGDRIWIGTMQGLSTWVDGGFQQVLDAAGKPLPGPVWCVTADAAGVPQVGTGRGVIALGGETDRRALGYASVNPIVPLGRSALWAIAKDRSETNVLVASVGGADWAPVDAHLGRKVVDLFAASDGSVWVVMDGDGLLQVAPDGSDHGKAHLPGLNVQSVFEDREGRIWCGRWGRGVVVLQDGAWQELLTDEDSAVVHITQAADGSLWFGTTANGVWRFDGSNWTQHLADDGPISLLAATSDGRVWVSSQATRGLKYWDGEAWALSLDNPMPVRCLAETDDGVWAGGVLDGIHILRKGE